MRKVFTNEASLIEVLAGEYEVEFAENLDWLPGSGFKVAVATLESARYFLERMPPEQVIICAGDQWVSLQVGTATICNGLTFHSQELLSQTLTHLTRQRQLRGMKAQELARVLRAQFFAMKCKRLNLEKPLTFTEKMQWLKLYDATELKSRLADKFAVRSFIAEVLGREYLIPLCGLFESVEDINFSELPPRFILKCTHGSGFNVLIKDKSPLTIQDAKEKLNAYLVQDFAARFLEMHYTRIRRRVLAEEIIAEDLIDYKFWCFAGEPVLCKVITGRKKAMHIDYFDMKGRVLDLEQTNCPRSINPPPLPKRFALMKDMAKVLSAPFSFVRIDFYEVEGRVYFGEMTFTPAAGLMSFKTPGADEFLGSLLTLPKPGAVPMWGVAYGKDFV